MLWKQPFQQTFVAADNFFQLQEVFQYKHKYDIKHESQQLL